MSGWIVRKKDASASFLAERALGRIIKDYGSMLNFSIDSRQKTMQVEVLLKGETLPITVNVQEYEFAEHEGQPAIILRKASASREWVNNVVQQFVVGKPLPLPGKLGPMVKLVA